MYSQFLVVLCLVSLVVGKSFDLQILHFNDFHARFEPVNAKYSNKCVPGTEQTCLGGISRLYSLSKGLKASSKNTLLLNAGDVYQGTLWYTLFKSKVTSEFMSEFPFDAFVVGNHDFDDGIKGLIPLLKKLKCPTVVANMDTKKEPSLKPYIKKSVVIKKGNQKIGIIGYDLQTFPEISRTGKLNFSDEATAVIAESKKLKSQGVNIIICLSHAGILKDIEVAEKADLVDVIVGGHSHTFMYTGTPPSYDKPQYEYPHVVTQESGRKVLVVQAGAYSRYLGRLLVTFDGKGEVAKWGGNPVLLDYKVPTDLTMDNQLEPYKEAVNRKGNEFKGYSNVELQTNRYCYSSECNMGNFVTDGMVYCYVNSEHDNGWTQAAIAVINAGGLRTSIDKGNVTYGDVLAVIPFGSTIDAVSLNGTTLYEIIEYTVTSKNFLQWSGLDVTMDPNEPEGSRVKELKVLCTDCEVPVLETVEEDKYYRVLVPSFLYKGGDGYTMFAQGENHTIGMLDSDCFFSYLKRSSPVTTGIEGRIHLLNEIEEPREHLTIFN